MKYLIVILFYISMFIPKVLFAETPKYCQEEGDHIGPMHPHIRGHKGDTCPICGMKLTKDPSCFKGHSTKHHEHLHGESVIYVEPKFQHALGVKTEKVSLKEFGGKIRAFGEVVLSSRNDYEFHMRTKGWIVDLKTNAIGDEVKKGDLLFTYYSPDLIKAQTDYLVGSNIENAEERLRLFGMGFKAIEQLKQRGQHLQEVPFYSPVDGIIVNLNVRQGYFLNEGDLALSLQSFDDVWVNADVAIKDLSFISENQNALVIVPATNKQYQSRVDFIHHIANPDTRNGIVRLVVEHNNLEPKPGTYVDVIFNGQVNERLAVPKSSVLYDSHGALVFENMDGGYFKPVRISLGISSDEFIEVTSGLEEGQIIVKSGQFLLDAESNLRNSLSLMGSEQEVGGHHGHH